jgi:hypothetical protein
VTDIVERLRPYAEDAADLGATDEADIITCAADEIDRLRQALGEMVTTFYDAGCHICGGGCASANPPVGGCPVGVIQRARAALGKDQT